MTISISIQCDVCKAERKETNNWIMVWVGDGEFRLIWWDERLIHDPDVIMVCGQAHAHVLMERWLDSPGACEGRGSKSVEDLGSTESGAAVYEKVSAFLESYPHLFPSSPGPPKRLALLRSGDKSESRYGQDAFPSDHSEQTGEDISVTPYAKCRTPVVSFRR